MAVTHSPSGCVEMLRSAVAVYLMLVTAAGPWYCCCTAALWAGSCSTVQGGKSARASSRPSCCQHRPAKPSQPSPTGKGPANSDRQDIPGCPCQEHRSSQVAALPSADSVQDFSRYAFQTPTEFCAAPPSPLADLAGAASPPALEFSNLPFWTAQALLRAFHLLRC